MIRLIQVRKPRKGGWPNNYPSAKMNKGGRSMCVLRILNDQSMQVITLEDSRDRAGQGDRQDLPGLVIDLGFILGSRARRWSRRVAVARRAFALPEGDIEGRLVDGGFKRNVGGGEPGRARLSVGSAMFAHPAASDLRFQDIV